MLKFARWAERTFSPWFLFCVCWASYILCLVILLGVAGCDFEGAKERSDTRRCDNAIRRANRVEECIAMEGCIVDTSDLYYLERLKVSQGKFCGAREKQ